MSDTDTTITLWVVDPNGEDTLIASVPLFERAQHKAQELANEYQGSGCQIDVVYKERVVYTIQA